MNTFPSPFAPGNLISRDGSDRPVPSRLSLLILHTQAESGAYSRGSSRFPQRSVYLFISPCAIRSVPSLSVHAIAYRWYPLPRVHRHRASSPQGSSSNGCCHFAGHHGLIINARFSFPPLTTGVKWLWHVESFGGMIYNTAIH